MQKRKLGTQGLEVPELGLGCMGMSWAYGTRDDAESLRVLHRALELGIDFWDSAELYGPFLNEQLLGEALKSVRRQDVTVATKFAWKFGPQGEMLGLDSSPKHIREALDGSLRRLGTDYIDLYYQHRLDPNTPIEETVGALAELVKAGKVRYIGLSEVGPGTIRRAHAVHPLTAVQSELSLWERGVEANVLPALRALGIGFVAYSPIGRGFLSGTIASVNDLAPGDTRRNHPRFLPGNIERNLKLVETVHAIAAANHATPAQVAIAWVLRQGRDIVAIPGTRRIEHLDENVRASALNLSAETWAQLDAVVATFETAGTRYTAAGMKALDTSL
jgi:aryl-alcohol dehydrogenase-like predicted oxidoreductase